MIKKNCNHCKKEFEAYPSEIRKGGGKYCARSCYLKILKTSKPHNYQAIFRNCLNCDKKFKTVAHKIKEGKGKYCCLECYREAHSSTITRICLGCDKEFSFPKWQDKTCCSLSCNGKWRKKKNKEENYVQKDCVQCQKTMDVLVTRDKDERGKFCSNQCRNKWMSIHQVGENAPGWKGGITPFYRSLRTMAVYRHWRKAVLVRDNHSCVSCQRTECLLEVDHITPLITLIFTHKITTIPQAKACKYLWDVANGQSLCRKCHHHKSKQQRQEVVDSSCAYHK